MTQAGLLRLAGLTAIGAGLLRMLAVFIPMTGLPDATVQQLYFLNDFLLLLGVFGVYAADGAKLGWPGAASLAVFVFGILVVRSPQVSFLNAHGYQAGAAIALLGIAAMGALMLARQTELVAPLLWLAALAAGLTSATGVLAGTAAAFAGVLFGTGFVAAGVRRLRVT